MAKVSFNVSLDQSMVATLDRKATESRMNRSEFTRSIFRKYLGGDAKPAHPRKRLKEEACGK